jgi:SAM-dependent methyltransferase
MKYKIIKKCQICNSKLFSFLNLGKQPLCDDLSIKPENSIFYKLEINFCKKCLTAYQKYNVEKKTLFPKQYHYRSANTNDVLLGMKDLVNKVAETKGNLKNKIVLDVGCNDGSLLDFFKKKGCKTYGVEPTNAFKDAKGKGHKIYNQYFDIKSSLYLKKKLKDIDIITFTNVFAHIENFKDLLQSLKILITKNTLLVIENHYLGEVIKKNQFDTFYHEHPRTYSLNSFNKISDLLNIKILNYEFVKRYNGNLRVFLGTPIKKINIKKIKKDINKEKKMIKGINNFQKNVDSWKMQKKTYLTKLTKKIGPLPAKAFPGRASILIHLLKLNNKIISGIYEKDFSLKVNKYAPGTNIKILKEKYFTKKDRDKGIIINMAWHISSEIRYYLKNKLKYKGKIIDIISNKDF